MVFICLSLVEPLYQEVAMGWISALEYMLTSVHGLLRLRLVMPGAKYRHFLRP
jgi:hypothetical protein